jgi:hypothetical protein
MWGDDSPPVIDGGPVTSTGTVTEFFPELGGSRFFVQTLPAGYGVGETRGPDMDFVAATAQEAGPAGMYVSNGWHYTNTLDCGIMISGTVWLIGPGGQERQLLPGDSFVDAGAPHAWENRGIEPCTFVLFIVGASRTNG